MHAEHRRQHRQRQQFLIIGMSRQSSRLRHGPSARVPGPVGFLRYAEQRGKAREIRERQCSHILVMPEYRTSLVLRKLATATDAMQRYPGYAGRERWTDRIWYDEGGLAQPLSAEWPDGGPLWVRAVMMGFLIAASRPLRPLTRVFVWCAGASRSHDPGPAAHLGLPRAAKARPRQEPV